MLKSAPTVTKLLC